MEIKLVVSVDDKTADLITNLINALLNEKASIVAPVITPVIGAPKEEVKTEAPKEAKAKAKKAEAPKEAAKTEAKAPTDPKNDEDLPHDDVAITVDELRAACIEAKRRCGDSSKAKAVIAKYGAPELSKLDKQYYKAVIDEVNQIA